MSAASSPIENPHSSQTADTLSRLTSTMVELTHPTTASQEAMTDKLTAHSACLYRPGDSFKLAMEDAAEYWTGLVQPMLRLEQDGEARPYIHTTFPATTLPQLVSQVSTELEAYNARQDAVSVLSGGNHIRTSAGEVLPMADYFAHVSQGALDHFAHSKELQALAEGLGAENAVFCNTGDAQKDIFGQLAMTSLEGAEHSLFTRKEGRKRRTTLDSDLVDTSSCAGIRNDLWVYQGLPDSCKDSASDSVAASGSTLTMRSGEEQNESESADARERQGTHVTQLKVGRSVYHLAVAPFLYKVGNSPFLCKSDEGPWQVGIKAACARSTDSGAESHRSGILRRTLEMVDDLGKNDLFAQELTSLNAGSGSHSSLGSDSEPESKCDEIDIHSLDKTWRAALHAIPSAVKNWHRIL